jgi:hypothetical protein
LNTSDIATDFGRVFTAAKDVIAHHNQEVSQMQEVMRDVATELDTRIAVGLSMTAGSIGPLGGTVEAVNRIHKDLNVRLAAGRLTDRQYAQKCRELLNLIGSFDGLIAEAANGTSQR